MTNRWKIVLAGSIALLIASVVYHDWVQREQVVAKNATTEIDTEKYISEDTTMMHHGKNALVNSDCSNCAIGEAVKLDTPKMVNNVSKIPIYNPPYKYMIYNHSRIPNRRRKVKHDQSYYFGDMQIFDSVRVRGGYVHNIFITNGLVTVGGLIPITLDWPYNLPPCPDTHLCLVPARGGFEERRMKP